MYGVVRRYQSDAGLVDELARRVREGFVPIISRAEGFVAYYVVDAGEGAVASISLFEDSAAANESTRMAADWVKQNLAELVEGPPEITAGEVVVQAGGYRRSIG
jgi:hypothetical protein